MAARTGEQFLRGLAGRRDLWVGGDKVSSVVDHPALSGAARALAEVFDLQHRHADACLMPDPETGEPINISHMIPRSREDLQRRHRGLECVAEYSVGLMGRTPDYMNVTFAGFAGRADEWAINGNERGAENLVRYQKKLAREDLSLTHTIIHSTVDLSKGRNPIGHDPVQLHKVERDGTRHPRAGFARAGDAGALLGRTRRLSQRTHARRGARARVELQHSDGYAGPEVHLSRQRVGEHQSFRPSVVEPLRRAGRLRHLRRRRGAQGPCVHRCQPRRLQLA